MTRIRTLHDIDNLQKWNLDNRKKMKEWPGFEPTNIRSKVRCACHIATKTQWRKSHNSSKPLVMKFTRKNQKFPKKCWPHFFKFKVWIFFNNKKSKKFHPDLGNSQKEIVIMFPANQLRSCRNGNHKNGGLAGD